MATFEDFSKIEIRAGTIVSIEAVPETDKLLKLTVDFGEENTRTVVSGIRLYFPEFEVLTGTQGLFVTNLEPRVVKDIESQAMILCVDADEGYVLLRPEQGVSNGARVR
jgi:methionyl-tRNA synthetase